MNIIEQTFCPVCGSSPYKTLFYDHNRRDNIGCSGAYVQCKECSLVYLRERPPWDEIIKLYSLTDEKQITNTCRANVEELRHQIEGSVPVWIRFLRNVRFRPHSWPLKSVTYGSKRLLDLGCGSAAKLFEFAERGYEVWGVDVAVDAIRRSEELRASGF